jgi:hypothetical protein
MSTISTKKIWNCSDGRDQIWIDQFGPSKLVILGMVMVKFG